MTIDNQESRQIAAVLAHRAGSEANAAQIAEAVVVVCIEIESAIAPIVGSRGVSALFRRTLHLVVAAHPDLSTDSSGSFANVDPATLRTVFERQSSAVALASGSFFLQTFHELLASLIGPSLTERLLRPVWAPFTSGPSGQD